MRDESSLPGTARLTSILTWYLDTKSLFLLDQGYVGTTMFGIIATVNTTTLKFVHLNFLGKDDEIQDGLL